MTVVAPSVKRISAFTRAQTRGAGDSARTVAFLLCQAVEHEQARATDWRPLVRAQIRQLAAECSISNWDGYEATPVSRRASENAQRFVDLLPADLPQPTVVPDPDGHIALCWDFGTDRLLTVSIGESDTASYAGILGKDVKRYGQEPFHEDVAKVLVDSIREISSLG
jgi:hypothetical protein